MKKLPDFPWDRLEPYKERARAHPDGIVDLSVGTPVDPVPRLIQDALVEAANSPGYPLTHGTKALREAAAGWLRRRQGVIVEPAGRAAGDRLQGVRRLAAHAISAPSGWSSPSWPTPPTTWAPGWPEPPPRPPTACSRSARSTWTWSGSTHPATPPARCCPPSTCARSSPGRASAARSSPPTSATSSSAGKSGPSRSCTPTSASGSHDGLLALHSLSKRSNLAGYRAGFVTGDPVAGQAAAGDP